jgi:TRAP-type mannitol/chloroaromatic compound transport system permease small subunit
LTRKEGERTGRERVTAPISYLLWLTGGFVGLHRFYLRSVTRGFGYVALFLLVLYSNKRGAAARIDFSEAANALKGAEFSIERYTKLVTRGREGAAGRLERAKQSLVEIKANLAEATNTLDQWDALAGGFAALIAILLLVDAFLIPRLRRRCLELEAEIPEQAEHAVMQRGSIVGPRDAISTPATRAIDALSGATGTFVAYWSVIAVFVYYYEVIARYVFNSPTNWAHESMFLMFGMQYLLSGAFALRDDAHVRVDVLYEKLGERAKAVTDVITSFFFFVFSLTLLGTGVVFGLDAVNVLEVSFTEWAIQYWPVKLTIALGALLILLQGTAKLIRDVTYLARGDA